MSADWGSFFHLSSGTRSSMDESKPEAGSGEDEVVEPEQGNGM
jgi:hypothetical protein